MRRATEKTVMKQKVKLLIILSVEFAAIAAMLLMIFFAGKKTYTVTFDLNGGTLLSGELVQRVTQGQNASPPQATKDGCYFLKWSGSYREVTRDLYIEAVWEYETSYGIEYESAEDSNYCIISGSFQDLVGDIYIGAYHDEKKVLGIKEGAFQGCEGITGVYLLDGILTIGDDAFAGCTNLKTIELPSTLTKLGARAFKNCASLSEITLYEELQSIGTQAFSGCISLTEIVLPLKLKAIGSGAFDYPLLTIYSFLKEEEKPLGWALDWCKNNPTLVWGYVVEEETEDGEAEETQKNRARK